MRVWSLACLLLLTLIGCSPSGRSASEQDNQTVLPFVQVRELAAQMQANVRQHAERIASFGPRQTGQVGCSRTFEYVKSILAALNDGQGSLKEFGSTVTVPLDRFAVAGGDAEHSSLTVEGLSDHAVTWDAYSLFPNSVQDCRTTADDETPRRLVDLGLGEADDFTGKSFGGAVVLLDYNSADAWLLARQLGAAATIFIEPSWTNWRQSDLKYLDMVPLHMPRLYIDRDKGATLREAMAAGKDVRVAVRSRLAWRNVPAPCIEYTVAGKDPTRTYIMACQFDARSMVPDMAYGGDEVWGIAAMLELARYYSAHQPAVNLRFIAVSGHWQAQRCTRDYIAYGQPGFSEIGNPVQLVMGLDFSTETGSLNLTRETAWDDGEQSRYQWFKAAMFREGGWYSQIYGGLDLAARKANLYAGQRQHLGSGGDEAMAPRDSRSPFTLAPHFYTANEAWASVGAPTFAFQTDSIWRLTHNSPLDRFAISNADMRFKNLRPQLEMTLAVLDRLMVYPSNKIPPSKAILKHQTTWGEYSQVRGRMQTWDPATGWFSTELPRAPLDEQARDAGEKGKPLQTFIYALSTDAGFYEGGNSHERGYLGWPLAPHRRQHQGLQSFMFREIRLLDEPTFRINAIHTAVPSVQIDVLGYALDDARRILYATDYGVHGDGNPAFQATDVKTNYWDLFLPVTLFPCGSVELYDLLDIERWKFGDLVAGQFAISYGAPGNHEDRGIQPFLRVTEVKNAESHTDMRSWSYVQYGPTAMVFLPTKTADVRGMADMYRAEILLGERLRKFTPLLNSDEDGVPHGYQVDHGQTIRINQPDQLAAAAYTEQMHRFDTRRLAEFAAQQVASPLADQYHQQAASLIAAAQDKAQNRQWYQAWARYAWAWTSQTKAYSQTVRLLIDVVSTTVFYFTLLIPFAFLVERLIFPQTHIVKTSLVATAVFAVFVGLLYVFHPGFHLASNIVVTIVAFLIVVMTIPALILLLVRGVGMLKAMGSRAILLQRSEAETAGVVSASLSLSVSNMRRRKMRTGLTLSTITTLVVALVLLTTSTSFEFSLTEPQELTSTSFYGIQIYNATDHRNALLPQMVDALSGELQDDATVLQRQYVNYSYFGDSENGMLYITARGQRAGVPYLQLMSPRDGSVQYQLPSADVDGGPEAVHLKDLVRGADDQPVWFGPDDVNVCMLPSNMAEQLGVRAGDTIGFLGQSLTVLGIWESRIVKRDDLGRVLLDKSGQPVTAAGPLDRLTDLDAQPITPLNFAVVNQVDQTRPPHARSSQIIILPQRFQQVHRMLPVNTWSLIVIPHDLDRTPEMAGKISKQVMNVDVLYRYTKDGRDRIEMISMLQSTQVKGSGMMFFMLVIAVLMILAIMMGTVYERMREISIFSSVGLAPRHVAGMFLIESLVYAGLASVLGYFIGIAALWFLARGGLLPTGFYPNYLGVYVLYAIGVAMVATVASSLYPIRVASRLVNPSLERSWKIGSDPENDRWRIVLPFIATSQDELSGMMAYAYGFLAVHQGERAGAFVCQTPPQPVAQNDLLGVRMDLWLAPFERNVTQHVLLQAEPGDRPGRSAFVLYLERLSGPEYLWQRSNRAFVDAIRKHLLNWRGMNSAQIDQFVAESKDLFAQEAFASA